MLGYDVPLLSKTLDWISVMTYDYHGQWDKKTGHVSPMYSHPDDYDMTFNAVINFVYISSPFTILYHITLMGITFYLGFPHIFIFH